MAENEIIYRHGDTLQVLGKTWLLDFIEAEDADLFIYNGEKITKFSGLAVTTEHGGVMHIVMDRGNPKQTFIHEIIEAFLTEMTRALHEKGGEIDE